MTALVLAVDGFGPYNGWGVFLLCMLIVIGGGGGLGYIGRKQDNRKLRGEN